MFRQARFALFTAGLTVSAMVAAAPAHAQEATGSLRQAIATAASIDAPSFLVTGIATNAAEGQQSSSGSARHEGFGIGAEVGPTFNTFSEANEDFSNNNGFEGGIFFGGNRPGLVGVMGKILYAKKGAKDSSGTSGVDLYYLEIPVLARVNVGSSSLNGINFYGIIGPAFDIRLKAKQDDLDVKDNYEALDIGLQFGGGIEITRFLVEANYTKGLRRVNKGDFADLSPIKTKSFAILFGIRFN